VIMKKKKSEDIYGFTHLGPPSIHVQESDFWIVVCLCVWMCASLLPEQLGGFYSNSVFESLSIIGQC
jgi:hypothetical protein